MSRIKKIGNLKIRNFFFLELYQQFLFWNKFKISFDLTFKKRIFKLILNLFFTKYEFKNILKQDNKILCEITSWYYLKGMKGIFFVSTLNMYEYYKNNFYQYILILIQNKSSLLKINEKTRKSINKN